MKHFVLAAALLLGMSAMAQETGKPAAASTTEAPAAAKKVSAKDKAKFTKECKKEGHKKGEDLTKCVEGKSATM